MTEKLYDIDSHLKEFEARVLSCRAHNQNWAVELSKTAFFPEGGGQGSDKGKIGEFSVVDVQEIDGKILHIVEGALEEGSTVKGVIDWSRRFDFMQQHSGEHIVSGVAHSLFGCENVGFHLGEDIVTLDFDKVLTREQILKIETLANEAVFSNVKFSAYYPDKEVLKTLNYRSKKEIDGAVRIVEIENTDMCACCAPHVNEGAEIGIIKLLDSEKLRGGVRIQMKCGRRALADYNEKYDNIRKISGDLAVKQNETAQGVERLLKNIADLKFEITGYKKQIIEEKVAAFSQKNMVSALFEDNLDIKELQHFSDALFKKHGGIRGVFSPCDGGFSFAICGEPQELEDFFAEFKNNFSIRGGGRNGMVQGTVFNEKSFIENFFKKINI